MLPNVLLICTDQQRFSALGASGNEEIDTPNLDRLASQGVLFENCYCRDVDEAVRWVDLLHRDIRTDLQESLLDTLVATESRTRPRLADW